MSELRRGVLRWSSGRGLLRGRRRVALCRGLDLRRVGASLEALRDGDEHDAMIQNVLLSPKDEIRFAAVTKTGVEGESKVEETFSGRQEE